MDDSLNSNQLDRFFSNIIRRRNAVIERINFIGNTGYITIFSNELITLVVNINTVIQDNRGRNISARSLRRGMVVDAVFSAMMTRSIPPQSRAYKITVVDGPIKS